MKSNFYWGVFALLLLAMVQCKPKSDEALFTPVPEKTCDTTTYNFNYCRAPYEPKAIGNQYYTFYYSTGAKRIEANFVQGFPSGFVKIYYPSGNIRFEGTYSNQKANGFWKAFYETGSVMEEGHYNDCLRNGFWKIYYESSRTVKEEGSYKDGRRTGTWQIYNKDGQVEQTLDYNC